MEKLEVSKNNGMRLVEEARKALSHQDFDLAERMLRAAEDAFEQEASHHPHQNCKRRGTRSCLHRSRMPLRRKFSGAGEANLEDV